MPDGNEPVTGAASGSENGESAGAGARKNYRGTFFASPIVQAHHFQLSQDFIEVASATGKKYRQNMKLCFLSISTTLHLLLGVYDLSSAFIQLSHSTIFIFIFTRNKITL